MRHEELIQLAPDDPRRCRAVLEYMRAGRSRGIGKFEWETIEAVLEARTFQSDTGNAKTVTDGTTP
jgi:hypothetical protein